MRVAAKEVDGRLLICVADDGAPIPPEAREALLRPFVTADEARTSRGGVGKAGASARQKSVRAAKSNHTFFRFAREAMRRQASRR